MYFKTSEYPSLKGMTKKDQNNIIAASLRKHSKWVGRRFYIILLMIFIGTVLLSLNDTRLGLPSWFLPIYVLSLGLMFYLYLLWEINGAIFESVSEYTQT
jgi:protein-S-isoprenylcysteine O-methyltransferase Ste14